MKKHKVTWTQEEQRELKAISSTKVRIPARKLFQVLEAGTRRIQTAL